jgi:hypothetical protein
MVKIGQADYGYEDAHKNRNQIRKGIYLSAQDLVVFAQGNAGNNGRSNADKRPYRKIYQGDGGYQGYNA